MEKVLEMEIQKRKTRSEIPGNVVKPSNGFFKEPEAYNGALEDSDAYAGAGGGQDEEYAAEELEGGNGFSPNPITRIGAPTPATSTKAQAAGVYSCSSFNHSKE